MTQVSWREASQAYFRPQVMRMLLFGFSAGLPFLLVFSTLNAWLRTEGVSRTAIGFFAWIGITYSIKFLWSPIVDKIALPGLTRWVGQRRGWMLLAQVSMAIGLTGMAFSHPMESLLPLALFAVLVAFASATQDIAIDAFRIEAEADEFQAAMASTYIIGYRIGLLTAGAGALYIADYATWKLAYLSMACATVVGMIAVFISREPSVSKLLDLRNDEWVVRFLPNFRHRGDRWGRLVTWLMGSVVAPLLNFFQRFRWQAIIILLLVGVYKISDISMAAMANPLYIDLGFSLSEIATVTKLFGLGMTIFGGILSGILVARYGIMRMMLVGAVLVTTTNLLFVWLAGVGHELAALFVTIGGDNFSNGFAATCMIAWMSSLVDRRYTATQYALMSSLMTLPGKVIAGFSGIVVDTHGYPSFFLFAAALGVPSVLLCIYFLIRKTDQIKKPRPAPA